MDPKDCSVSGRGLKNNYGVPMGISKASKGFSVILQITTFNPKRQRVFVVDHQKVR